MSVIANKSNVSSVYFGNKEVVKIYEGSTLVYEKDNTNKCLCFTSKVSNNSIILSCQGTNIWTGYYSLNGTTWIEYTLGTIINLGINSKVYFKGIISSLVSAGNYLLFLITDDMYASGNIMSLCAGDNYQSATTISYSAMFYSLFSGCSKLLTAPSLPATTLSNYCYASMFEGCTSLTKAPSLPATVLGDYCYETMFSGCSSLVTVPNLPATNLTNYCYSYMFAGCSSLFVNEYTPITGSAECAWFIPKNDLATSGTTNTNMFISCLGTRTTSSPNFKNTQKVYYTQNNPV